ncbi:50S ribosomal protein L18e [Candidatus Woesearchaeota archaeon]|nr:MAG: 50S ribosomal protein L18e [Candidatus Woesearchaeota archaeon]
MKNLQLESLIKDLKKKSIDEKVAIWKRIATDLEKPSRQRRIVNLSKLSKNVNEGDVVIVPGKILGDGDIDKKITIAAFQFSDSAKEKLIGTKSTMLEIADLMSKNPKGQKVKIIG